MSPVSLDLGSKGFTCTYSFGDKYSSVLIIHQSTVHGAPLFLNSGYAYTYLNTNFTGKSENKVIGITAAASSFLNDILLHCAFSAQSHAVSLGSLPESSCYLFCITQISTKV